MKPLAPSSARHEATLIRFAGDGVMVLVNAPVACENPAQRGIRLAIDMQAAVQSLANGWNADGCAMGFGVGIAMGPATVGTARLCRDASTTRRSETSSIWRHGFAIWRMTRRSWWIRLSPSMSRTALRLRPSESGPSRATIMRWRFLRWFAASGRCRILAVSYSLLTSGPLKQDLAEIASELSPADAG